MGRSDSDRMRPPRAGEPITARYLAQEYRRNRRNRIVAIPPLYAQESPGGIAIGVQEFGLLVAIATSAITAATRSGTTVTAFGTGTAELCDARSLGGCEPNSDKSVDVYSLSSSSIASGSMILLGELPRIGKGLFVLGRVCP